MNSYSCRAAAAAVIGRLRSAINFRKAPSGPVRHIGPTRNRYLNLTIQREAACAEIQRARKSRKKAPFAKARSLTIEILRQEVGRV